MYTLLSEDLKHIWDQASDCLAMLQDKFIFITGGTGLFGLWLLESILYANEYCNANIRALILTRDKEAFFKKMPQMKEAACFEFLQGDVADFKFPDTKFAYVIHAATESSATLNRDNPLLMYDTITKGTRRVLEFAVHANALNFLFTSSGAVYGKQPCDLHHIPETYRGSPDPLVTTSAYGLGKLAAEHSCMLFNKHFGLSVKIARCFAFVGPYLPLNTHFAIGNFIGHALRQETIHIAGDGTPYRSYLYMADLTAWLWKILCHGETGQAYNVGSDEAISIAELATLVSATAKKPLSIKIAQAKNPAANGERYVPDVTKAKETLNLTNWINLTDAISRTINWNQLYAKS